MARKLIVANWKMYLTLRESVALVKKFTVHSSQFTDVQIVICPSFVALEEVAKVLHGTRIKLGAQDVEPERRGAFTGEVGLDDLRALHVKYVLVGHSERRRYFKETDAVVNKKLHAVLKAGMRPILCVGEPSRPPTTPSPSSGRRGNPLGQGAAQQYVAKQLRAGLKGVAPKDMKRAVIAYEPVWAIGTGSPDTPSDASEMHAWIEKVIVGIYGGRASLRAGASEPEADPTEAQPPDVPILYGGSVNAKNAAAFARAPGVDGLLIGKASTRAAEFINILRTI